MQGITFSVGDSGAETPWRAALHTWLGCVQPVRPRLKPGAVSAPHGCGRPLPLGGSTSQEIWLQEPKEFAELQPKDTGAERRIN